MKLKFIYILSLLSANILFARNYHVSPEGNDNNSGTKLHPFQTIQRAATIMRAGDSCYIASGRYHESIQLTNSGTDTKPIRFIAADGAKVVIDGTEKVSSQWEPYQHLFRTKLTSPVIQLFYQQQPMTWARWPNMTFNENWQDDKKWERTGKYTTMGQIVSNKIADLNVDLTNALLYIKLSKGNNCFTRPITKHIKGKNSFTWAVTDFLDNPRLTGEDGLASRIKTAGLANNRFFVTNKLELLDTQEEWFYDGNSSLLYFKPPHDGSPRAEQVRYKVRDFGFKGTDVDHIEISGIDFFACTAYLERVRKISFKDCQFFYPYELQHYYTNPDVLENQKPLFLQGESCVINRCLVKYSPGTSIYMLGRNNKIINSVVCESGLHGRHNDPNIVLRYDHRSTVWENNFKKLASKKVGNKTKWDYQSGSGGEVTRSTVYNCSGVGIYVIGRGPGVASYNHVFNVGMYCSDVSSLYIPLGHAINGGGFNHNWTHDINGLAFRCDQDGRDVHFHHNVAWNCKAGMKANGYDFKIYHNTIYVNNPKSPIMIVQQENEEVMTNWPLQNNTAFAFIDRRDLKELRKMSKKQKKKRQFILPLKESHAIHHNKTITEKNAKNLFVSIDEDATELYPSKGSALVDRGVAVAGVNDKFKGKAPDIGAYELGETYWVPGADWLPDGLKVPQTMSEATKLARKLLPGRRLYQSDHDRYGKQ